MSVVDAVECGQDVTGGEVQNKTGLEDKEEFDAAAKVVQSYCKQITEDEFEEQGASETEKALVVMSGVLSKLPIRTKSY